jgi:DnaJ-class molecular chaperone
MNLSKNYYKILEVEKDSNPVDIKKSYYKLSHKFHPDKNKDADPLIFQSIVESYKILSDDIKRSEYDKNSKYGKDYNELNEFFLVDMDINYDKTKSNYDKFKKRELLDIYLDIDKDAFNGSIEYVRYITCKDCQGTGKDSDSKIVIKDEFGNIKSIFEPDGGCDFCEGTGKDWRENTCLYCSGSGKIGSKECSGCKGERRILGKQKLTNIKLDINSDLTKIEFMGNASYYDHGKKGSLILNHIIK